MSSKKPKEIKSGFQRKISWAKGVADLIQGEVSHRIREIAGQSNAEKSLELRLRQATQMVNHLANLKGSAMKLGQILALEAREFFPDEIVEILEKLQSSAEPLGNDVMKGILYEEFKERASEFKDFSQRPIASASIGQVHTAKVAGKEVAVKLQYPGVKRSIETDVVLLKQFLKLFSVVSGRGAMDTDGVVEEIAAMFNQETDYRAELAFLEEYRTQAASFDDYLIPGSYPEFSSSRVLTTEFIQGISVSQALRENILTAAQKAFYSELFMKLYTYEFCIWGLVQTDPNLGNFLIQPKENRLVLLDFGATRRFTKEFRRAYSTLVLAAYNNKPKELLEIAIKMKLIDEREDDNAREAFLNLIMASMTPFRVAEYDFGDGHYARDMRQLTQKLLKAMKFSPPPRELLFLHRKLGGIFQILRRLESKSPVQKYLGYYEDLAQQK